MVNDDPCVKKYDTNYGTSDVSTVRNHKVPFYLRYYFTRPDLGERLPRPAWRPRGDPVVPFLLGYLLP